MRYKRIKIVGYRSFSEEGIELTNLNKVNLIIGPNNAGKSNLFRALRRIVDNLPDTIKSYYTNVNNIKGSHKLFLAFTSDQSVIKKFKQDTSIKLKMKIDTLKVNDFWDISKRIFSVEIEHYDGTIINLECKYTRKEQQSLLIKGYKNNNVLTMDLVIPYLLSLYTSTVLIDEIRSYNSNLKETQFPQDLNGRNELALTLREHFFKLDGSPEGDTQFKVILEKGLQDILLEDYKVFRDPHINKIDDFNPAKHIILQVTRGGKTTESTLPDVGSGIGQILLFISIVYAYMQYKDPRYDEDIKLFIEEPEHHFHPEAMIRLFQYLLRISKGKMQFIINTHTPWLIDHEMVDQIYKIQMNENGYSNLHQRFEENKDEIRNLLDLLGVRPSHFLQSNMVIWVEGPSDRIYIKAWLNLMLNKMRVENDELPYSLIEGKHYSFFMYGGSLLKYYSYDDNDKKYINLLSTSRYAALVCDTDNVEGELKDALKRWIEILNNEKHKEFVIPWRTKGKEIENYVPQDILYKVIKDLRKQVIVKSVELGITTGEKEERIPITMIDPSTKGVSLKTKESFATFFSGLIYYDLSKKSKDIKKKLLKEKDIQHNALLNPTHKKRVKLTFNSKKAEIALKVIDLWKEIPDSAESDIKRLLNHILKANNINNS